MADNKIKAVLFDFGETLVSFGKINRLEFFKQGARLTHDFLMSLNQPASNFRSYYIKSMINLFLHLLASKITGNDFDSLKLLKKTGQKSRIQLNEQQWQKLLWLWYEPLNKIAKAEPDLLNTLTELKKQGLKLGIVSNTFVNGYCLDRHLKDLGIFDMFDTRLYSYQLTFRKPDPRIFITAADRIGVHLPNILYVGDRIIKDIEPTLKLDMQAALKAAYTNQGRTPPKQAWKIEQLSELPALIEKYNNPECL